MKATVFLPCVLLLSNLIPLTTSAQPSEAAGVPGILERASKLRKAGNHREAVDEAKKLLAPALQASSALRADALALARQSLSVLNEWDEFDTLLEDAARDFAKDAVVLAACASERLIMPHHGFIIDGKFTRDSRRGGGRWVRVQLRDRVRALQWLEAARAGLGAETPAEARRRCLEVHERAVMDGLHGVASAWKFQILTDLTKIPDYDEQEGGDGFARGFPVDAKGDPVFVTEPESWEKCASDGQRLMWLWKERSALSAGEAGKVQLEKARLLASWFSVSTLVTGGRWGLGTDEDGKTKTGIAALHTLRDDETVAKLASGPRRFTLPPGQAFLPMARRLAEDENTGRRLRLDAWNVIATELTNRRQNPRAAEALRSAIKLAESDNERKGIQVRLDQIVKNWARLEPLPPQPAGRGAKLSLVFRNATKISFTARRVDLARLIEDTKAWLRTEPQNDNWWQGNLDQIGHRLLQEGQGKYLGKPVASWSAELQPAADHWDRRVEIATPLQSGGAFFIEGKVDGGNTARALLWIEDLVLVEARQSNGSLFYLADAVSGAPVADAEVSFFGYDREWKEPGVFRRKPRWSYSFREFRELPDASGVAKASSRQLSDDHQWMIVARDKAGRMAARGFRGIWFGQPERDAAEVKTIYTVTDRPVYRPAQTVKWRAWARASSYNPEAELNPWAGKRFEVEITNERGEKVFEQKMEADASGALGGELALAEDATLGAYSIQIHRPDEVWGQHTFRVEEYKKPEFEVKVSAPEKPVQLGDAFEVKVKADYYFGGPVREGKVKYRIERSAHAESWYPAGRWDWLFGPGYGWRTTVYDWYPGSDLWCKCLPPWPWFPRRSDPPELIAAGEQAIGADGTLTIKVDTALAKEMHGDQDHQYTITAEVTDNSRRTIFGNGKVLAARRPFDVQVWLDRGYYQAGEPGVISVSARTLDGRPVKAAGAIRVWRVSYDEDGKPVEKEAGSFVIKADEEGRASQQMKWDTAGQYRVSVKLKDEAGHEIEGAAFTVVRGDDFKNGKGLRFDDLEIAVRKDEYGPGEEVEVLVNANRENARVGLFIGAAGNVYPDPVWLQLDGKSVTHRFKVEVKDQPNLFVEAFTVSDAKVHRVTRQIIVPPTKSIASVELILDKKEYLPREKPKLTLRAKDQDGRPFAGDVILTGYDKALEYISGGSNQRDIREIFWGWKRHHSPSIEDTLHGCETGMMMSGEHWMSSLGVFGNSVADLSSGGMAVSGASGAGGGFGANESVLAGYAASAKSPAMPMAAAAAPAKNGRGRMAFWTDDESTRLDVGKGRGAPVAEPMIRSNLADSAIWLASVKTNEAGEASLDFPLPDNLTTWSLRSWIMGPRTQVGEAKVEIITRKNVMVRLQAPRFFVEKDEVTISANIHNETDKPLAVTAALELEGGTLALTGEPTTSIPSIPAHGEKRVDWRVKVTSPGEATIRVKALAEADSDAMEMKFPVFIHGALKTDSWSLGLRPEQQSAMLKVRVPEERRTESTRLEVRFTPSLGAALVDTLPYLAGYPYGCTEQTLNRFVPTIITLKVLRDLGADLKGGASRWDEINAQRRAKGLPELRQPVFSESEVVRMARAGIERLEAMRNGDGGWGWFPGGGESSPHITALVVHGMAVAREAAVKQRIAGIGADEIAGVITPGLQFLARHEAAQLGRLRLPEKHRDHKRHPDNLDALVHSVLVEQQRGDKAMRQRLYEDREHLTRYSAALLGLACHQSGEKERRDMLARNLRQFVKEDAENQTAWLDLPGGWYWHDDEVETMAVFLRLISAAEPKGDLAPRIAKYLVNNRQHGFYWKSTRDTAAVVEALADFMEASGESEAGCRVELLVDGKPVKQAAITRENLFSFDGSTVIEGAALGGGEHTLEVRKEGKAPLYVNAFLTVFSKEDMIPAAGLEVKVRRTFYRLVEERPDTQVAGSRGQVVKQQGFKYSRVALASDAEMKSGDLIEVELSVESKNDYEYVIIEDLKPAGFEPVEARSGWRWEGLRSYQELRDEKVAFFADWLPRGTHNLSYRVKAETPGRFSALPARIEAMYAPELRGNSDEWKTRIGDR